MKQLEKKDLKKNDIFVSGINYNFINKLGTDYSIEEHISTKSAIFSKNNTNYTFSYINLRLATPEQKHWLEACIAANNFISYEDAMKSFIPEYYEYVGKFNSDFIKGKIYKIINKNNLEALYNFIDEKGSPNGWSEYNYQYFKPSTKEAYDAQFVVKKPEFVLPEKWCIKCNEDIYDILQKYALKTIGRKPLDRNRNSYYSFPKRYNCCTTLYIYSEYTEITFEQFKKYVLKEQLEEPKDKVTGIDIDTNKNKIVEVECAEGGIYKIGDKITVFTKNSPNKGKVFTIEGFRWNKAKTAICAITEAHTPNGIGLDKIELYLESVVKELSLLEQAKLKYPIGTKFKNAISKRHDFNKIFEITTTYSFKESTMQSHGKIGVYFNNEWLYFDNKWAEIIEDFKLPETWWITIENERQLEIVKQYFSQYFTIGFKTIKIVNNIGFVNPANWTSNTHMFNLTEKTKQNNLQITFEQFEQYVLHNGFKVGDRFSRQRIDNYIYDVYEKEIVDLQYINGYSVAFYKSFVNGNSTPQSRILTKNIIR